MADDTKLTLGTGVLKLNAVDVGRLKGDVEFTYTRETVDFKPSNATGVVKRFLKSEGAMLKASLAEIKMTNLRLALGGTSAGMSIDGSSSFPSYNPSSYSPASGASFDVMKFGGSKAIDEITLEFEHTRPNGKVVVVVLYSVVSNCNLNLNFAEEDVIFTDIEFEALIDTTRTAGDQIGVICEQVMAS